MGETAAAPAPRGARLRNDPNRFIRMVKGGRFQARPYVPPSEGGEGRVNLGCFATAAEARQAVLDFWWGRRPGRLRWARPVPRGDGTAWIAVVRIPPWAVWLEGRRKPVPTRRAAHRLPGEYPTAELAHAAAARWLVDNLGLLGWWMTVAPVTGGHRADRKAG